MAGNAATQKLIKEISMAKLTDEEREMAQKYGHLFGNTGGNDPIELMEHDGINYFNNPLVAELQGSCYSQTRLLLTLKAEGILAEPAKALRNA